MFAGDKRSGGEISPPDHFFLYRGVKALGLRSVVPTMLRPARPSVQSRYAAGRKNP